MSKKIILKGLYLKNFKGIKELDIDFGNVTSVYGDNATGKTTIGDSFNWLLFDKDSQDKSKFSVQPLDENNNTIHMLETEVQGTLEIDGVKTVLRKILKEKWVKKRGEANSELKGTETSYYSNEVPKKQGEYQKAISGIIPEDIFKLLTNPLYFSSVMKWQDRREIIFKLNGDVTVDDIISSNEKLKDLTNTLNPNEDLEGFTKRIKAQKKKLTDDKKTIPARVDELTKTKKEDIDFDALELRKKGIVLEIKSVDENIADKSKVNDELLKEKDRIYLLKSKLKDIEQSTSIEIQKPLEHMQTALRKSENKLMPIQMKINTLNNSISTKEKYVSGIENEMQQLRNKWVSQDEEKLILPDDDKFVCPTCKRKFETIDIEAKKQELTENFNENKAKKLAEISSSGIAKKGKVEKLKEQIGQHKKEFEEHVVKETELKNEIQELQEEIKNFNPILDLLANEEYQNIKKQVEELETKLTQPVEFDRELQDLKDKKKELDTELQGVNTQLSYKEQNESLKARIAELQEKEKQLAQKIADLEKQEFLCEEFIKAKVNLLESGINSKFKYVKFKLFDTQANGGINENCEVLVNGVPFNTNLNSAARLNAGLDIINTLSEHYEVQAPIFIDNKESVTKLIDTDSQVINLVVSESDKILRIESEEV